MNALKISISPAPPTAQTEDEKYIMKEHATTTATTNQKIIKLEGNNGNSLQIIDQRSGAVQNFIINLPKDLDQTETFFIKQVLQRMKPPEPGVTRIVVRTKK